MKSLAIYLLGSSVLLFSCQEESPNIQTQKGVNQIIADHTIIDDFDKIPENYIAKVKEMWVTIPGESHSKAYRIGLTLLEEADNRYSVNITETGPPEPYINSHLRASRATWGDLDHETGWRYSYGEEDWFTSENAVSRTKNGIAYANNNNFVIAAIGFGWCYDPGIDVDLYLNATQKYIDFCNENNFMTVVFFTTGPVDDGYSPQQGYESSLVYKKIREYVAADSTRVLFDYADILCFDEDGKSNTRSWSGNKYPYITNKNLGEGDIGHIGEKGAIRLAKGMWWMLARIAGWDGRR